MQRILVAEKISAEGLAALKANPDVTVDVKLDLDKTALVSAVADYEALVVRSATKVTAEVIEAGKKLKVLGRAGAGVDNIDITAATKRGIIVVNAPDSLSVAVAELALGLMLGLARNIPAAHSSFQGGKWEKSKYMGWELRDKTLGLIGLGRIGSEVAKRARGMQMKVLTYDPVVSSDRAAQLGVESVTLEELLSASDIISIHVPLVDATRNLINAERLSQMKKGAFIVNTSRGPVINDADLLAALESGQLGGAALDVFSKEPPENFEPFKHPKLITTPHLGASTEEAQVQAGTDVAEGVLAALAGGTPRYAVNAPFVAPEAWNVLAPFLRLGRQLGALCTQLIQDPVKGYEVEYTGELATVDSQPVRLALLQGLLEATCDQPVTPVNAPLIARERGLKLTELSSPDSTTDYTSLLTLRVLTAEGPRSFTGTILGNEPHIVQVDGYPVSFVPGGPALITYHNDRPGIIGRVGTLLGAADVNISGMYVGRLAPRDRAMMVLALDEPVAPEILATIRAESDIGKAYCIVI